MFLVAPKAFGAKLIIERGALDPPGKMFDKMRNQRQAERRSAEHPGQVASEKHWVLPLPIGAD
jgi:hypothetical protein